MKLSVVIPFHYGLPGKEAILQRCVESLRGHDELIVIGNDGKGVCYALNVGMRCATGDFIIILNDDTILTRGDLRMLCHPGVVTHPLFNEQAMQFGSCICFPREVYEAVGEYDEGFRFGYYEDDDMLRRIEDAGYPRRVIGGVNLAHPDPGHTLGQIDGGDFGGDNRAYYMEKWGDWRDLAVPPVV